MRFEPFHLKSFPYIEEDLSSIEMDLSIARLGKNAIRLPDRIVFSANFVDGMRSVTVPLDEEGYKNSDLSDSEKMCLRRIIDLLEQADQNDLEILNRHYSSQFDITRAIRSFDQNFGGKRFVDLARDLIDRHMGVCLYPYMKGELVLAVYLAYNKNVNRDVEGFMSSIVDFAMDFYNNDADLRNLFANIEEKSSEKLYLSFLDTGLKDPRAIAPLSGQVITLFTNYYGYRVNHARAIPVSMIASFPKETLIEFFEKVHPMFRDIVSGVFEELGEQCDHDYLYAYQRNPSYDTTLLANNPLFGAMDPNKINELKLREWVFSQTEGTQIVARFHELPDLESQENYLRVCVDAGWKDVAHALKGEVFSIRSLDLDTFCALVPDMNLALEKNRQQAVSYVQDMVNYNPSISEHLLLLLRDPAYTDVVRDALSKQKIRTIKTQLILADRFHCPDAISLKEWH